MERNRMSQQRRSLALLFQHVLGSILDFIFELNCNDIVTTIRLSSHCILPLFSVTRRDKTTEYT